MLRWIVVAAGLVVAYLVLAPVVLAVFLGAPLTAGVVDWSGESRVAPTDPIEIGYRGDPQVAFGYAFQKVSYTTELGPAEAWLVPSDTPSDLLAIWVHGIGGLRENGYRLVKILHEAGVPVLLITYRNDKGAPASPDRLFSFGLSEWRDLEAAVDWTETIGARRVAIVAESMGGAIAGQYLKNAADTSRVAGVALDSPALDFPAVISAGGRQYGIPASEWIAPAGLWVASLLRRDLREAVSIDAVAAFKGPIFLAHGRPDPLVPFSISERLVETRPDIVFYVNDADRHSFPMRRTLKATRPPCCAGWRWCGRSSRWLSCRHRQDARRRCWV